MAALSDVLAQIRQHESGGTAAGYSLTPQQNYDYPASHASGAYQFQPATWQHWTQASGIGTQYSEAYQAPPATQDAVAAYALQSSGGNANQSSLWQNSKYTYPQVDNYDVSPQQLVAGSGAASPGTPGEGFGGNGAAATSAAPYMYEGWDAGGNYVGGTTDPTGYPLTGATTYTPVYPGASSGGTPSASTPSAGTPSAGTPSATGAAQPGTLLGQPLTVGLTQGLANWLQSNVMNPITGFFQGALGATANDALRLAVVVVALVLLFIALWRTMDPEGTKTRAMLKTAAEAA